MTAVLTGLPRWDLSPIFPSLTSPEFETAFGRFTEGIGELAALFESQNIRRQAGGGAFRIDVTVYDSVTAKLNDLLLQMRTLDSYVNCFVSTDANDEEAKARESLLDCEAVRISQLATRYVAWVGTCDVEDLLQRSEVARAHEYYLRKAQHQAAHQMSEAEESLAAELRPASLNGWARLHGNVTALLTAEVDVRGEHKTLPMSSVRALSADGDRDVRRAAYEAELQAWAAVEVSCAAALNGVKGYQQAVRKRRNYLDDLEPTLLTNGIDRQTLEAMQQACVESFPDFRRYLSAKARRLGLDALAWYDVGAPVGREERVWTWPDAEGFVRSNFSAYSDRLAEFAQRSFEERWIDAEPRVGKEGGAYCTGLLPGVSRIMMNFDGSFTSVSTLAHELGHAYHNLNLAERAPLQRETPMTLAETASIFCETLMFEAAFQHAGQEEQVTLLGTSLQRDFQVVVDIHSRFLFESRLFEKRAQRDLTVSELKELMLQAQRETYGADLSHYHPYMWAVKGHYYGPLFYNYPYTFGLLFGIGLYAQYKRDPEAFKREYDDFLSSTGLADAATLARRFGLDVRTVEFWRTSLDHIRGQIQQFEVMVGWGTVPPTMVS
jgi:oligoendopeptidase F